MNIARFSLKRPILISCLVILMMILGMISFNRLGVDLFPPVEFPVVATITAYPGATPTEIEELISKPLEEQIASISGIERLTSRNNEGVSIVIAEFTYETNIKWAAEQVREKVAMARNNLPEDLLNDPIVWQFDPTMMPILTFALVADLSPAELYDLAREKLRPLIEQVSGVGEIRISGGTRREIQVELDRNKLNYYEVSASTIINRLSGAGANIPIGKFDKNDKSTFFRSLGQFTDLEQIRRTVVNFAGDFGNSITVNQVGQVIDGAEEATTISYFYYPFEKLNDPDSAKGKSNTEFKRELRSCLLIDILKQSDSNSVKVSDSVIARMPKINQVLKNSPGDPSFVFVYDTSKTIRANINDVIETIVIGIILAMIVVYLFLGNLRSTFITSIAIPNSLLGAFMLMYFMGFTLNMMSLLALSLTIGILVDDAIIVRENIFRKIEEGYKSMKAAEFGTTEVMLAVIATTLVIISVFFPIAYMEGLIGRMFRQFGLTVVFAVAISLFDALTVAPLLSGYFGGSGKKDDNIIIRSFERFQTSLDNFYAKIIRYTVDRPKRVIFATLIVFIGSLTSFGIIKVTFMPDQDEGEYQVNIKLPPETSLSGTFKVIKEIGERIQSIPELDYYTLQAGGGTLGGFNTGSLGVFMVKGKERKRTTAQIKEEIREIIKEFDYAEPSVDNFTRMGAGGNKPFIVNIAGNDLDQLNEYANKLIERLKSVSDLTEVTSSYLGGNPEFQIIMDPTKLEQVGITQIAAGMELRYHIEGGVAGKFHEKGVEYDIRVRLKPDQRDMRKAYNETKIPNIHNRLIPLNAVSKGIDAIGPSQIIRQDRSRVIQVMANISQGGAMGSAITQINKIVSEELPLPENITFSFQGQADSFQDMTANILLALFLSLLFIYFILASLYESFITPFTILMALPPALSGAFFAFLITGKTLDMFGMIGLIMLLGIVTKNSILLVDFALEGVRAGLSRKEAIYRAGIIRLRPILMTTISMIAATLPVALGAGEAAKYRTGLGVGVIGGLALSTILTLIVVPAIFDYVDRFREWIESRFRPAADNVIQEGDLSLKEIMDVHFKDSNSMHNMSNFQYTEEYSEPEEDIEEKPVKKSRGRKKS